MKMSDESKILCHTCKYGKVRDDLGFLEPEECRTCGEYYINYTDGTPCCENCFFAQETDVDGLVDCLRFNRSKDTDMVCEHWIRQD